MMLIIVEQATAKRLLAVTQTVELCAPDGRLLGRFVPATEKVHYMGLEPDITEEELRRIEQEKGGRTLAEIMSDLEKRV